MATVMATVAKTGSAVAAAVTVARRWQTTTEIAGVGKNQQNVAGGIGSGRNSSRGSGDCCSVGAMADQGGGMAEAMVQDDRERDVLNLGNIFVFNVKVIYHL